MVWTTPGCAQNLFLPIIPAQVSFLTGLGGTIWSSRPNRDWESYGGDEDQTQAVHYYLLSNPWCSTFLHLLTQVGHRPGYRLPF